MLKLIQLINIFFIMDKNLNILFKPKTIAVIGASNEKGSVGFSLFANLLKSKTKSKIYPVNIKRNKVQGKTAYKSISAVPGKVDLAIIAVPAKIVPVVVEECGIKGVKGLVIISAGFKEIGEEGAALQNKIGEIAKKYGMRIIGPNCLGFINSCVNLNASFAKKEALCGDIAFISQSGALGTAMLDWSVENNIGFSYFVSIGSMVDVNFTDMIEYLANDKKTKSILIYMESLTDAQKFLSVAKKVSLQKPIVIMKTGRSEAGSKAAKSHTGSLTGNDSVFSAAFAKAGIIRVDSIEDFFAVAKVLANQPRPIGKRLAVITNAGGVGVVAADSLVYSGGQLASLEKKTIDALNKILPSAWSRNNPIDILGDAEPERYKEVTNIVLADKNVDGVLVVLTPQAMTEPTLAAKELVKASSRSKKIILASWVGGKDVADGIEILEKNKIPNFSTPESAIRSFILTQKIKVDSAKSDYLATKFNRSLVDNIITNAKSTKQKNLNELDSKKVMAAYGLPIAKGNVANNSQEAAANANKIGLPVVMKVFSDNILHKIDVGGIELDIKSEEDAKKSYDRITKATGERRVYVEKKMVGRYELLLGYKYDAIFGPVIAFGTGGTAVEVYKDAKISLLPVNKNEIDKLVSGTKIYKLLKGFRNLPGVDLAKLQNLIYNFSYLVMDYQDKIAEMDINPLLADEKGFTILDAKIVLK